MKKLSLVMIGLYVGLFAGFAQSKADSSKYKNHKLSFEEANIVSSYYSQDGNNSAVTGGIGTEKLTDLSNSFELKLYKYDKRYRKNSFNFELGIDHYTSASSDMVDLKANSSASYNDTRIYPSINWTRENEKKAPLLVQVFLILVNLTIYLMEAISILLQKQKTEAGSSVLNFKLF